MKHFLLLIIFIISLFAEIEIDERKTDFFYANGVWAAERDSEERQWIIKVQAFQLANPRQAVYIGRKELAFNTSFKTRFGPEVGEVYDIFEAFLQRIAENPSEAVTWVVMRKIRPL